MSDFQILNAKDSDGLISFSLTVKNSWKKCLNTSLKIEISKPKYCYPSLNAENQILYDESLDLYNQSDLNLNVTSNSTHKITYGTNYLISLDMSKSNIRTQGLTFNHTTSKLIKILLVLLIKDYILIIFNNPGLFPIKINGIKPNRSSISFNFSEPKDCYSGYDITCSDNDKIFNANLDNRTLSGVCDNLTSGTNYTIKSTVYGLNNQIINENATVCTSININYKKLLILYNVELLFRS